MKILKVRQLTKRKWLNLYEASYEHNDRTGRWIYASRQEQPIRKRRADAVLIVPVLRAPKQPPRLVLIREYRIPVGGWVYAFPAGLLESGEDPAETARREMVEETGLVVTRVKEVSPILFSTAGMSDESIVMAFVDVAARDGSVQQLDKSEVIEVLLLDIQAVGRLLHDRKAMFDAKMWTILHGYQQLGRIE